MQTQQVLGVDRGGMLYASKAAPAKSGTSNFEQLIQMSQNAGTANEQEVKKVETKKESAADVTKAEQPEKPEEVSSEMKDTTATAEEQPELEKAEGKEEATDVEAAERVAGILNQVAEAVKEILGLTDEELNQFMEELGITNLDLLQPETLKNLVLKVNSEQDAVVLLTDAKLLSTVNELNAQVEQVLQEAGVTPEELKTVLENPDFEALVEEAITKFTEAEPEMETETETNTVIEDTNEINLIVEDTAEKAEADEETTVVENVLSEVKDTAESKVQVEVQTDKKETGTGEKEQNQTDSTEVDNFAERFVQNLTQAAEDISEITGQKDVVQMIREVADQILEKVKVSVTAETTSLEIVLTPEELGKVNLTVSAEQDGTMKARFVTENEMAKEAIERNLVQFKETLQEQGLKVDTIEVTVGNFEFNKNGQAGEGSQEEKKDSNRRFISDEEIGQKDDTDQLAKIFMEGGESTVNYIA